MEDIRLWMWFTLAMGGHKALARKLYEKVGSVKKIYEYTKSDYRELEITSEQKIADLSDKSFSKADDAIWFAEKYNVKLIPIDSSEYPRSLKNISDPPLLIYTRGTHFQPDDELCISVAGTSSPSKTGLEMAYNLGRELAASGVTVIGGMSKGIENAAHAGCLDGGGKTISVLAGGVNKAPQDAAEFMRRILNGGAVISEVGFAEPTFNGKYAQRNRLIAGLSKGTVIVEAGATSGSLVVAKFALEYNRDVFAVPGKVDEKTSVGVNELIKSGATPVTSANDIIDQYRSVYPQLIKSGPFGKNDVEFDIPQPGGVETNIENTILSCLKGTPRRIDELINMTKLPVGQFNGSLTLLELHGKIRQDKSGYYHLAD